MSTWNRLRWLGRRPLRVPYCRQPLRRRGECPRLEQLEDRITPSTITVTSSADSGANTLRAALAAATSGQVIDFAANVRTIDLTSAGLTIATGLTVQNDLGTGPVTIDGGGEFTVFTINGSVTVALSGLTITDGNSGFGGGIDNSGGFLTVNNCSFLHNTATNGDGGGGIFNGLGSVTVSNCTFSQNSTTGVASQYGGGAILNNAFLQVSGTTFSQNSTINGYGGGGIANIGSGTLAVSDSTFSGNSAMNGSGGGIEIPNNKNGDTVSNSTFINNSATYNGGGIDAFETLMVTDCSFSANSSGNDGGAIAGEIGGLSVSDCTISGNRSGIGGSGGGINSISSTDILDGTIVAGNFNGPSPSTTADDVAGSFTGIDNLIGTGGSGGLTNGVNGNQVGVSLASVGLAPPGDYGGPTQTFALLPGSLAIGRGQSEFEGLDQRGAPRPGNRPGDVGAFQDQGYTVNPTNTPQNANVNAAFALPLLVTLTENFANDPLSGATIVFSAPVNGASAVLTSAAVTNANGQTSVTATANGTAGGPYNVTASAAGLATANFALTNNGSSSVPTVIDPTDAPITATSANPGGDVTSDGGAPITARGVVYSLTSANANPRIGGAHVINLTATGTTGVFSIGVSGLAPGTTYSFAAYATNRMGTSYTSSVSFTTQLLPAVTIDRGYTVALEDVAGGNAPLPIDPSQLMTTETGFSATQLTYTVKSMPTYGVFAKNGVALAVGGTFTEDDINNGRVTFQNTDVADAAPTGVTTSFTFTVTDPNGNSTSQQSFVINFGRVKAVSSVTDGSGHLSNYIQFENGTVYRTPPISLPLQQVVSIPTSAISAGTDNNRNADVTVEYASNDALWTYTNSGKTQLVFAQESAAGHTPLSIVAGLNGVVDVVFSDHLLWQANLASPTNPTLITANVKFVTIGVHGSGASAVEADYIAFLDSGTTNGGVWEHYVLPGSGAHWVNVTSLDVYAISASQDLSDTADLIVSNRNNSGIVDHQVYGWRGTVGSLTEVTGVAVSSVTLDAAGNDYYVMQSTGGLYEHKAGLALSTPATPIVTPHPTAVGSVGVANGQTNVADILFANGTYWQVSGLSNGTDVFTQVAT
jgi:predicted outer membrane repeat protein